VIDRGTRHVGDRAHAQHLLAAGATGLAADPMFDYTRFAATVPAGALERLLWLESSRMGFAFERPDPGSATRLASGLFPALTAILNDERGAMAQERAQRPAAEQMVAAARRVLHGPMSPYGRDPVGEAGLSAVTRPELRRAYDDAYDPRRAVLVISGGVAPAQALRLVRRYFAPLATLSPAPRPIPIVPDTPAGARTVDLPGLAGPPRLLLAWPAAAAFADGEAALEVTAELLGGGPRPLLARALAGLARRVSVRQVGLAGAGQFEIALELTSAGAAVPARARVDGLMGELRAGRIDAEALAGARNRLRTRRLAELETPAGRAQRLARYHVLAGDAGYLRRDLERLAAVDARTLQLVVAARLHDDQRVIVTGGIKSAAPGTEQRPPAAAARPAPRPAPAPFRLTKDDPRWQSRRPSQRRQPPGARTRGCGRPACAMAWPSGGWPRPTRPPSGWTW
jgi:zinc protease